MVVLLRSFNSSLENPECFMLNNALYLHMVMLLRSFSCLTYIEAEKINCKSLSQTDGQSELKTSFANNT